MRRGVLVICALGLLWPTTALAQPTGRLLVSMRPGAVQATIAGVQPTARDVPEVGLRVVRPRPGESLRAAARRLRPDPRVRAVDVERQRTSALIPNDPAIDHARTRPATPPARRSSGGRCARTSLPPGTIANGDGVAVAVIDSGVDVDPSGPGAEDPPHARLRPPPVRRPGRRSTAAATARTSPRWPARPPTTASAWPARATAAALLVVKSDLSDRASPGRSSTPSTTRRRRDQHELRHGRPARAAAVDRATPSTTPTTHDVVLVAAAADAPTTEQGDPANVLQPTGTGRDLNAGKGLIVTAADFDDRARASPGLASQISLAAYGAFRRTGAERPAGRSSARSPRARRARDRRCRRAPPCVLPHDASPATTATPTCRARRWRRRWSPATAALVHHLNPGLQAART